MQTNSNKTGKKKLTALEEAIQAEAIRQGAIKKSLAGKRKMADRLDTRVIIVRTAEMHDLLNMAGAADKAVKRIRYSGDPAGLIPFYAAMAKLEEEIKSLCKLAELPYDISRNTGVLA